MARTKRRPERKNGKNEFSVKFSTFKKLNEAAAQLDRDEISYRISQRRLYFDESDRLNVDKYSWSV